MLVQRQVEARRARADVGDVVIDTRMFLEQRLEAFDLVGRIAQRRPFGQLQVDHQLQSARGREKLLWHEAKQQHGTDKKCERCHNHGFTSTHAPAHQPSYTLVERCVIGVITAGGATMASGMQLGQVRQQAFTQVRHEHHGRNPGGEQGDGYHLENRASVLAGPGLGGGDGQKACRGDQGTGQHWERGTGPGITGRLEPVEALLHLDRHHFHGNDRVIHQQAERQHQCAQGNLVQTDPQVIHGGKGHRQHQRNGQGDHQPGAQSQGEETHQQDDGQRFGQYLHEFANPGLHCGGLVGHLAQLHPGRQVLLDAGELGFQRLAQDKNIATFLHRHGQADCILAHEAHARCRRVIEAAFYVGDIADTERTIAHPDRKRLDLLHRLEAAADAQLQALARGLEETGGAHRILFFQRLLHRFKG
ncbi:hypothetical protein D9M71_292920 [compost metagenome]